ncbi:MAG: hypothetical protein QXG86_00025 [Candidatus Woesearchaeota archaeon]
MKKVCSILTEGKKVYDIYEEGKKLFTKIDNTFFEIEGFASLRIHPKLVNELAPSEIKKYSISKKIEPRRYMIINISKNKWIGTSKIEKIIE